MHPNDIPPLPPKEYIANIILRLETKRPGNPYKALEELLNAIPSNEKLELHYTFIESIYPAH